MTTPERVYLPPEIAYVMAADAPPDKGDIPYARVHPVDDARVEEIRARADAEYRHESGEQYTPMLRDIRLLLDQLNDVAHRDAIVVEVERRADAVVDAAIAWHESGQEGDDSWFDKSEALTVAINHLLELKT